MKCDGLALIAGVAAVAGCAAAQPQIREAGMVIRYAHAVGKYEAPDPLRRAGSEAPRRAGC